MVLVDTSVWIDHLYRGDDHMTELLRRNSVATHFFVIGELACGRLTDRPVIMADLMSLPFAERASDEEALRLIDKYRLWKHRVDYIDVHLLAAAMISDMALWTRDKPIRVLASELEVLYDGAG